MRACGTFSCAGTALIDTYRPSASVGVASACCASSSNRCLGFRRRFRAICATLIPTRTCFLAPFPLPVTSLGEDGRLALSHDERAGRRRNSTEGGCLHHPPTRDYLGAQLLK